MEAERRTGRSYNQYCAVARGLDIIGERWTLLIVRDLLLGPKRYKDLLEGLPGIGTNLLAARLRDLEQQGIVRRAVLPPPAGSAVYELTELGAELEPALLAIGRWGAKLMGEPRDSDSYSIDAYFVAMRAAFRPDMAAGLRRSYELRVSGRVYEVRVEDGRCWSSQGRGREPDVVLAMDVATLNAIVKQGLPAREAVAAGRVELVKGGLRDLERFVRMFSLSSAGAALT